MAKSFLTPGSYHLAMFHPYYELDTPSDRALPTQLPLPDHRGVMPHDGTNKVQTGIFPTWIISFVGLYFLEISGRVTCGQVSEYQ